MSAIESGAGPQLTDHGRLGRTVVLWRCSARRLGARRRRGHPRADAPRARSPARRRDARRRVPGRAAASTSTCGRGRLRGDERGLRAVLSRRSADPHDGRRAPADGAALVSSRATVIPDDEPRDIVHPAAWRRSPDRHSLRGPQRRARCGWPLAWSRGVDRTAAPSTATSPAETRVILYNARDCSPRPGSRSPTSLRRRSSSSAGGDFGAMNDVYREAFAGRRRRRAPPSSPA